MDPLLRIITIIGGLLALLKGLLDLLKEVRASRETLSSLWGRRRFRFASALALGGVCLAGGAGWFFGSRSEHVLSVQIWNVELDRKGSLIASQRFAFSGRGDLPDEVILQAADWMGEKLVGRPEGGPLGHVRVEMRIPPDLAHERISIRTDPPVPVEKYLHLFEGEGKARVRSGLDEDLLKGLGKDFHLEIRVRGYPPRQFRVKWGEARTESFLLSPIPIKVGVESFSGVGASWMPRLIHFLSSDRGLRIMEPNVLDALRKSIAQNRALIARSPGIQMGLRTQLELDYIVSGSYERK